MQAGKDRVLQDDEKRTGPHANPVLIHDHHRESREVPEVLLALAVELVNVQRDKRLLRYPGERAREKSARPEPRAQIERTERPAAEQERLAPGVVIESESDRQQHMTGEKPEHEPIAAGVNTTHDLVHLLRVEAVSTARPELGDMRDLDCGAGWARHQAGGSGGGLEWGSESERL